MARYEFEENAVFPKLEKADPQVIGEALEQITLKHDGRLKPEHVVEEAKRKNHPLHKHFEWNDSAAARAYRLDQARALIRSVRIVSLNDVQDVARAYHSIQDNGRAYRSVTEIQNSALLQLSLMAAALRDLKAFESRYRNMADICALVKVAREGLEVKLLAARPAPADEKRPTA